VLLREVLLSASRSPGVKRLLESAPVAREVVRRFVAGETLGDAVHATRELTERGLQVTLDHLGEDTLDRAQAEAMRDAGIELLDRLGAAGLTPYAEVSLKLTALGQALPSDGEKIALDHARAVCAAAARHGTTVTLDMEEHATTDSTLGILRDLRTDFPWVGAVLQSYLRRTEADCRDLAYEGSRVRLCKGAYHEPESVAYRSRDEVDRSFVRCLRILIRGPGYPMVATHDPRLIEITAALAARYGRKQGSYEYQMLYGVRPDEQRRLAAGGDRVRVYVPYGTQWYGYLMRRLAERPANVAFFARSVLTRG
jgi:proline dehydrogenase